MSANQTTIFVTDEHGTDHYITLDMNFDALRELLGTHIQGDVATGLVTPPQSPRGPPVCPGAPVPNRTRPPLSADFDGDEHLSYPLSAKDLKSLLPAPASPYSRRVIFGEEIPERDLEGEEVEVAEDLVFRMSDSEDSDSEDAADKPEDGQEFTTDARIVKNYSDNSHVLLGDFKDRFEQFRLDVLRPSKAYHFNGRLLTGPGWVVGKESLEELKASLAAASITFDEVTFDPEQRKNHIREYQRKRYAKKTKASFCWLGPTLRRPAAGEKTPGACPRISHEGTARAHVCNQPLHKHGVCYYHWKVKYGIAEMKHG